MSAPHRLGGKNNDPTKGKKTISQALTACVGSQSLTPWVMRMTLRATLLLSWRSSKLMPLLVAAWLLLLPSWFAGSFGLAATLSAK